MEKDTDVGLLIYFGGSDALTSFSFFSFTNRLFCSDILQLSLFLRALVLEFETGC